MRNQVKVLAIGVWQIAGEGNRKWYNIRMQQTPEQGIHDNY